MSKSKWIHSTPSSTPPAQLDNAKWELNQTTVRAPSDGYVTNIGLRKGARVTSLPLAPAMAFIDTPHTAIGVVIAQIDARYVEPGQPVELTFKFAPGMIYSGRVERVLQAIATGQIQTSGMAVARDAGSVIAVRDPRDAR